MPLILLDDKKRLMKENKSMDIISDQTLLLLSTLVNTPLNSNQLRAYCRNLFTHVSKKINKNKKLLISLTQDNQTIFFRWGGNVQILLKTLMCQLRLLAHSCESTLRQRVQFKPVCVILPSASICVEKEKKIRNKKL